MAPTDQDLDELRELEVQLATAEEEQAELNSIESRVNKQMAAYNAGRAQSNAKIGSLRGQVTAKRNQIKNA